MPEIAEVARVAHFLRKHLVGKRIARIVALDDTSVFGKVGTSGPAFEAALTGKRVVSAGSQGKYFWLELDKPPHAVMHLGMSGWVHIRDVQTMYKGGEKSKNTDKDADKDTWPPKYWKFHLETDGDPGVSVAFTDTRRFGRIRLVDCPGAEIRSNSPLVENGPDPVVDREIFTEEYLSKKMKGRHVPIKAFLLDQAMISGIGNWVGDEVLYQAKLHPEQYSDDFSNAEITRLYKAICFVCDTAVEVLGDSEKFPEDWLFNYRWGKGKADAPKTLPNGEKLMFLQVGGRTSCVVPSMQKKTGRVSEGIKQEELGTRPDAKQKKGNNKNRRKDGDGNQEEAEEEAELEVRPAKKARSTTQKAVKKEDDEIVSINEDSEPKKSKKKTTKKQSLPPRSSEGTRRSSRLSKTES
ncbi:formamidopyrimidine-DNA glycosylase [Xylaria sp. FL1777]|nr:formamidopyrimidine-DNA glycosylase [Xylaria sp. FL1777]